MSASYFNFNHFLAEHDYRLEEMVGLLRQHRRSPTEQLRVAADGVWRDLQRLRLAFAADDVGAVGWTAGRDLLGPECSVEPESLPLFSGMPMELLDARESLFRRVQGDGRQFYIDSDAKLNLEQSQRFWPKPEAAQKQLLAKLAAIHLLEREGGDLSESERRLLAGIADPDVEEGRRGLSRIARNRLGAPQGVAQIVGRIEPSIVGRSGIGKTSIACLVSFESLVWASSAPWPFIPLIEDLELYLHAPAYRGALLQSFVDYWRDVARARFQQSRLANWFRVRVALLKHQAVARGHRFVVLLRPSNGFFGVAKVDGRNLP